MIKYEDVLGALRDGYDPDKLANEFATLINTALKQISDDQKADEKAKMVRLADTEEMLDNVRAYMSIYFPNFAPLFNEVTPEIFLETMDIIVAEWKKVCGEDKKPCCDGAQRKKAASADPINEFLRTHGLLV